MDLPEVERQIEIDAPPEEVWEKVVDGDVSEEWLGVTVEPRVGGAVQVPDKEIIGTVEEIIPGKTITWSWREIDGDPSQVTIHVAPSGEGSKVTVTERLLDYQITGVEPFYARAA